MWPYDDFKLASVTEKMKVVTVMVMTVIITLDSKEDDYHDDNDH